MCINSSWYGSACGGQVILKNMKMSQLAFQPVKTPPKDAEAISHKLLVQAGFIDQVMAGVFTFLPLGLRVLTKIENIVREEMDKLGTEILMPSLAPKQLWEKTGRIETVDVLMKTSPANKAAEEKHNAEYILNSTHEELVTPLIMKQNLSYKDLPLAVYQIQTKFRNEPRAKSGIMRTREFRMKDLYSFHTDEADLKRYYEVAKESYKTIYQRLGIGNDTYISLASGGDFTKDYSHEFQTRCESGEDTIYLDKETGIAYNKEVAPTGAEGSDRFEEFRASEVGNIFPLNTKFSEAFDYYYTDKDGGKKIVYMGSYGIGTSRLVGVIVEKFHDDKGIIWPENVAPFRVSLISMNDAAEKAAEIYDVLTAAEVEVLWDDRDLSAGVKFADADLIGNPYRVVVGQKSLALGGVELKKRGEEEMEIVAVEEIVKRLS